MENKSIEKSGYWYGFKDWSHIQELFNCNEPEPEEVILAILSPPSSPEDVYIIYRKRNKYFIVYASLLLCDLFEEQWDPGKYTKEEFKKRIEKFSYFPEEVKKYLENYIKEMK